MNRCNISAAFLATPAATASFQLAVTIGIMVAQLINWGGEGAQPHAPPWSPSWWEGPARDLVNTLVHPSDCPPHPSRSVRHQQVGRGLAPVAGAGRRARRHPAAGRPAAAWLVGGGEVCPIDNRLPQLPVTRVPRCESRPGRRPGQSATWWHLRCKRHWPAVDDPVAPTPPALTPPCIGRIPQLAD